MADKNKNFAAPTAKVSTKRPSTVSVASSSRSKVPQPTKKDMNTVRARPKTNKNATIIGDADSTILKQEGSMPDFDGLYRQVAYGKFLRAMLEQSIYDDLIQREKTQVDIQMSQLAERFQKTVDHLDKTNRRMKDISFIVEQKRLLNLKNQDMMQFCEISDKSDGHEKLEKLRDAEKACLNKLETKNIDFGYDKDSGHKQLLEAVNDAIDGLEQIKKHSKLDPDKFKEHDKSKKHLEELTKERSDWQTMRTDFEAKFPNFNEALLKEASMKLANMMSSYEDDDDDD